METVKLRLDSLIKALETLNESLILIKQSEHKKIYTALRDSVIQRFEYSIDSFWKFLKTYLQKVGKIDAFAANPRETLRTALNNDLMNLEDFNMMLKGMRHRNLTSHIYDEERAEEIFKHIPQYYETMKQIVENINL